MLLAQKQLPLALAQTPLVKTKSHSASLKIWVTA
jgi:hypothetical protein